MCLNAVSKFLKLFPILKKKKKTYRKERNGNTLCLYNICNTIQEEDALIKILQETLKPLIYCHQVVLICMKIKYCNIRRKFVKFL